MEMKIRSVQPGPWRGGQKDPGGLPNWFICQIIGDEEDSVIGHGFLCSPQLCRGSVVRALTDSQAEKSSLISLLAPGMKQRELPC